MPKGFKLPHDQQKYDGSQEPQSWLSDYLQTIKNTRRNKGNNNGKFAIAPHRRSQVMVEQIRKRNNRKLGGTNKAISSQHTSGQHR
jgi:hypothetical protein